MTLQDPTLHSANNPYHKTAATYERRLNLPVVRSFRRAERRAIVRLLDREIKPADTVLEIGCGTGYYTREIAARAAHIIALDDSQSMLEIMRGRMDAETNARISTVHSEGTLFRPEQPADIVVHIGVLDYVAQWEAFLTHSVENARRSVIFTCPTSGPWGQLFHLLSRWQGIRIQRFDRAQIERFVATKYPEWSVEMELVGLNGNWSGALTWVCLLHK